MESDWGINQLFFWLGQVTLLTIWECICDTKLASYEYVSSPVTLNSYFCTWHKTFLSSSASCQSENIRIIRNIFIPLFLFSSKLPFYKFSRTHWWEHEIYNDPQPYINYEVFQETKSTAKLKRQRCPWIKELYKR